MKQTAIKLAAHALHAKDSIWTRIQIRALTLYLRARKWVSSARHRFMAKFFLRTVEVKIEYADAPPKLMWMSEETFARAFRIPDCGEHDGRGTVVGYHLSRLA